MTRIFLFVFLALCIAGCGDNSTTSQDQAASNATFPSGAEDKVIFVNYWAEWCHPCREEIPDLNSFQQQFADQIALYGVNFDGVSGEALQSLEKEMGIEFSTLAADPGPRLGWPQPQGLPYTMVTDSRGSKLIQLAGIQTPESLQQALEQFLESDEIDQR